ncbi:MAG: hypothetical protein ACLR0S_00630 [Hominenteromicrobium sp.]|uniref:hypothetical protein n=1 Tax=Hominenteromicrobium sp. TaxID=3073581 RepID=UPI0039A1CEDD
MLKNGLLTLLFAFIPGAGQMYQGYMKRGLSLMLMCCVICVLAALFSPLRFFCCSFLCTAFLIPSTSGRRSPWAMPRRMTIWSTWTPVTSASPGFCWTATSWWAGPSSPLARWIAYENIIMNLLNDVLWRWGRDSVVFRAFYLVMDRLPNVVLCVALILCGVWLVRGPQKAGKKQAEAQEDAAGDADFQEYHAQPDAPETTLSDDTSAKEENGHDE